MELTGGLEETTGAAIAIVGMSVRVPGAADLAQFWHNLRNGVESITFFSDDELRAAGVDEATLANPDYVKAAGCLADIDQFDAAFFDFTPREAEILDPQHRLLLEGVWRALEQAAIDPERYPGRIGLFAGVGLNGYLLHNLMSHPELLESVGGWQLTLSNDKDFATTRAAYKLNLQGAVLTLNTACSTSLVAIAMAAQSLLSHQCDVIVAGGCSIHLPQDQGYIHVKGGTLSPDGHCRPFDAQAAGTIDGNGSGFVVLKRLAEALADGDSVYGVIRGFAINNDGSLKVGYSAPSVAGQADVIQEALEVAGLGADAIDYVETHGTATELGDMVEISALTEAFRATSKRVGDCALGAVKSNIGHLDTAAGVVGVIKTVLAMNAGEIPPTCHFRQANPKLGLEKTPFFVNNTLIPWPQRGEVRRAGVSSFGIGGTNAHVILEQAPPAPTSEVGRPWVLFPLSARSQEALEQQVAALADHIEAHPEQPLADIAHTLQMGRRHFSWRQVWVLTEQDRRLVSAQLRQPSAWRGQAPARGPAPIFLLPGQDAHAVNMALALYHNEPYFRSVLDQCRQLLWNQYQVDLLKLLYPDGTGSAAVPRLDARASIDPLPLYIVNYALAKLWMHWGVTPRALAGYSLGEYVAATLAGVFSFSDGIRLAVGARQLLGLMLPGQLLAVSLSAEQVTPLLPADTYVAIVAGPNQVVVAATKESGPILSARLQEQGILWHTVPLGLPFHSPLMQLFLDPFQELLEGIPLHTPKIPYLCSVTGRWITPEEATDIQHYLRLVTSTVRLDWMFERLFEELTAAGEGILLEVGPNQVMSALALQHPRCPPGLTVLSSLPDPRYRLTGTRENRDQAHLLETAGRLWLAGVELNWTAVADSRRRLAIPGHPFKTQRFWLEPNHSPVPVVSDVLGKEPDQANWFYLPGWRRCPGATASVTAGSRWLVITDAQGLAGSVVSALRGAGAEVITVSLATGLPGLTGQPDAGYQLDGDQLTAWQALFAALGSWRPQHLVHLGYYQRAVSDTEAVFHSQVVLAHALGHHYFADELTLSLVADGLVALDEPPQPAKAAALGPWRVMAQEYPNLTTRVVDVAATPRVNLLVAELADDHAPATVALRGARRWREAFERTPLPAVTGVPRRLRRDGVYLITGGLGNIGLTLADYLAETLAARLVLVARTPLPPREQWSARLADPATPPRLAKQLRRLQALEAKGAQLLIQAADVSDAAAFARVLAASYDQFGALHGVIHAAGLVGEASFITLNEALTTQGAAANHQQFPPKVTGTEVLAELLAQQPPLDFCLICSSLSSLLGGLGFAGYAATNLYVDARVETLNQQMPGRWLGINWEGWMFEDDTLPEGTGGGGGALELGMNPAQGREAFARLMDLPHLERLVISSGNLQQRLAQWVERQPVIAPSATSGHPRPELLGEYTPPATVTEQRLVALWEKLLGIDGIGVDDSFFELGGNSLLLTQLVAMMRRTFQVELALAALFEQPTVAAIAAQIDQINTASQADDDRDEGLL